MTDQSEHSAESMPENLSIDATELFNAALKADESGKWGNDGAFEMPPKEEPSVDRAPDASGDVETKTEDKAEPSAEPQEHTGHPEGAKKPTGKPVIDALGREHDPATGRILPKKEAVAAEAPETKPETPYSKAKKEEERQKSVMAKFQERQSQEWDKIRATQQQLAEEKAQIERFKQVPRAKDGSPHKFNSQQYSEAADDFYGRAKKALSEGDVEQSNQFLAQAEACSQSAEQVAQFEQQNVQQQRSQQFQSIWNQNRDYAIQHDPELAWNNENPSKLNLEIKAMINDKEWGPIIQSLPNGFGFTAQVMKWKVAAEENSALSEKLKKAEERAEKAESRLGIRPAPVGGGMPKPTSFDDLSDESKRRALMQEAQEQDRVPSFG